MNPASQTRNGNGTFRKTGIDSWFRPISPPRRRSSRLSSAGTLLILILATISISRTVSGAGETSDNGNHSGFGAVIRIQSASNRAIVHPVEGNFKEGMEIQFLTPDGDYICNGRVQSSYSNLVYAGWEGCKHFDEIKPGSMIGFKIVPRNLLSVKDSHDRIDEVVREVVWKRSPGVPLNIREDQYTNLVVKSKVPVLLVIYSDIEQGNEESDPVIHAVAKELEGRLRVATLAADKCPSLVGTLKITRFPANFLFVNGKMVDDWRGLGTKKAALLSRLSFRIKDLSSR